MGHRDGETERRNSIMADENILEDINVHVNGLIKLVKSFNAGTMSMVFRNSNDIVFGIVVVAFDSEAEKIAMFVEELEIE
jgi:hypothetical protein